MMGPTVFLVLSPAALLGVVLAQAPGDQDQTVCLPEYEYPVNVIVLMDSWKYRKNLLPSRGSASSEQSTVWDRLSLDESKFHGMWFYDGLACEDSELKVCSLQQEYQNNWLFTQYINKSVPATDAYPVRVFVNITYTFMTCLGKDVCSQQFELLKYITNSQKHRSIYTNTSLYSKDGILLDNVITRENTTDSGTKHFYFDMSEEDMGFYLALQDYSEEWGTCVTVSRVLVYRHECRAFTEGRVHFPAVQAPVNDTVLVSSGCTENPNHRHASRLECTSEGQWKIDQIICECDFGYYISDNECKAYIIPMSMSYVVSEEQQAVDVCYTSTSQTSLTVDVQTNDNTAIANFDYVPVNKLLTFGPPSNRQCVEVHVTTDTLQEKEESFVIDVVGPGGMIISHTEVIISPSNTDSSCENGSLTLSSGMDGSSLQLVEMCSEGVWSPVCDHNWTVADAAVVCRELGYHHLGLADVLESGMVLHHMQMVPECEGMESNLTDCLELFDDVMICHYVLVECRNYASVVAITTSLPSPEPTVSLPSVDASDSVHVGTIAGVAGSVALVAILVMLVLLVIVILWKRRKDKEPRGGYLDNPIYSIAEGLDNQLDGRGNGNPKPDKAVEEVKEMPSSHVFENPIYDCAESSTNSQVANTHQPEYATLEESEPAEYEVPLVLSPTAENNHHPSIYDSATFPDQPTGVDDSVLEHVNHIYSCLEEPGPYVASSGKQNGQQQPAEVEGSQLQGEYSFIEPK